MTEQFEKDILQAVQQGISKAIHTKMEGYNSPLDALIKYAFEKYDSELKKIFVDSMASSVNDPAFKEQITKAIHHRLAKTLIERFGGEMKRQVNALKSDPSTRAKITLAIEEIVIQNLKK